MGLRVTKKSMTHSVCIGVDKTSLTVSSLKTVRNFSTPAYTWREGGREGGLWQRVCLPLYKSPFSASSPSLLCTLSLFHPAVITATLVSTLIVAVTCFQFNYVSWVAKITFDVAFVLYKKSFLLCMCDVGKLALCRLSFLRFISWPSVSQYSLVGFQNRSII